MNSLKTVMVVDDNDYVREVIKLILRKEGYTIVEAEHGEDALKKIADIYVDLIVTDFKMPVMNGLEFVKNLRVIDRHKSIPVIMLTSENRDFIRMEGSMLGVKEWLIKPILPVELISAVKKII